MRSRTYQAPEWTGCSSHSLPSARIEPTMSGEGPEDGPYGLDVGAIELSVRRGAPIGGATAGAAYGNSEVRSIVLGGEEVMGAIGPEPLAGMGWLKTEASNTAEDFEGRERRVSIVTPISRTAPIAPRRPSTPDSMPRTSDERSSSMLAPCSGSGRGTRDAGHPSQSGSGDPPNSSGQTSPSNPPSSSP